DSNLLLLDDPWFLVNVSGSLLMLSTLQLYLHLPFLHESRQLPHSAFLSSKTKMQGTPCAKLSLITFLLVPTTTVSSLSTKRFQSQHLSNKSTKNSLRLKNSTRSQQQRKGRRNQSSCLQRRWEQTSYALPKTIHASTLHIPPNFREDSTQALDIEA
ncbi:hypothetical protein FHG87_025324, partial [Trinorchestia longiramus]